MSDQPFERVVHDEAYRFREFKRLWSAYRASLSQPFGKDREEDSQITARVDAAFQALDQLSKEMS